MIASSDFPKIPRIKKRAFLAVFSRCGSLSKAAKRAKVDRRTHYNWLRDDPWYKQAFRQAIQEAGDALEDKLNDLAHEEGNVTAAIFLLKGLWPEKYKDRTDHTFQWNGDPATLSEEHRRALEEYMISQAIGSKAPAAIEATRKQIEAEARAEAIKAEASQAVVDVLACR